MAKTPAPIPVNSSTEAVSVDPTLGRNVARLRQGRGLSQSAVASAANLNPAHISRIENGLYSPSTASVLALMKALETDANGLLLPHENPSAEEKELSDLFAKIRRLHPTQRVEVIHLVNAQLAGLSASVVTRPHPVPFDEDTLFATGERVRNPTKPKKSAKT